MNANGSLSGAGSGSVTVSGIGAITPTDAQDKVDNRLSSTEKTRLNAGNSPDNTKAFNNAGITLAANGVLSGGGSSTQVNIGSIASTPFDTSGNVDTGETIAVGSKITIDRNNERILIED